MSKLGLAFIDADFDDTPTVGTIFRKFLKPPAQDYPFRQILRIGDHLSLRNDFPFHDDVFMRTLRDVVGHVNKDMPEADKLYIYIPDHSLTSDRNLHISGRDEKIVAQTCVALKTVSYAYQHDEVDILDARELASEVSSAVRKGETISMAWEKSVPDRIAPDDPKLVDYYLRGGDIDPPGITNSFNTMGAGHISFPSGMSLDELNETQNNSLQRLRSFLKTRLHVDTAPAPQGNRLNLHGAPDDVHIAHLIGRRAATVIDAGRPLTPTWIYNFYRDSMQKVADQRVSTLLDRRQMQQAI